MDDTLTIDFDWDAYLDVSWTWAEDPDPWLEPDETIVNQVVTPPSGLEVDQVGRNDDNTIVTAWVKVTDRDAVTSPRASISCHIVTSAGREDDRSIILILGDR